MKNKLSLLFVLISMTTAAQKAEFKIGANAERLRSSYDHTDTIKGTVVYKLKEGQMESVSAVRYDLVYNEVWKIRGADSVWKQFSRQNVQSSSVSTDNPYAITGWYRFDPLPFNQQSATTQERRPKNSIKPTVVMDRAKNKVSEETETPDNKLISTKDKP